MTEEERFERIMAACRRMARKGNRIAGGFYGVYTEDRRVCTPYLAGDFTCLCPMGALLVGTRHRYCCAVDAAQILDCSPGWEAGFTEAFDRAMLFPVTASDRIAGRAMAARVRAALDEEGLLFS